MDFISAYGLDGDATKLAFSVRNAAKDVGYYAKMAESLGATSIMSGSTLTALETARDTGYADKLVPDLVDFYAARFSDGDA